MTLWTVVEVGAEAVELRPDAGGAGGESLTVAPADLLLEDGVPAMGDVLDLEVDGSTAIGSRVGRAQRLLAPLKVRHGAWECGHGAGVARLPYGDVLLECRGEEAAPRRAPTEQEAQALHRATFWLFNEAARAVAGHVGHFADAADFLVAWHAARAQREEARRVRQAAEAAGAAAAYRPDRFINPYNFVPLPRAAALRRPPIGHLRRWPGLLSGTVEVEVEALTPLALRGQVDVENARRVTRLPRRDGVPIIPAASLKGAVRALMETFTGSCFRSVDLDALPGYRDQLRPGAKQGWTLAAVEEVDQNGRPTRLRLCDEVRWVEREVLVDALGATGVETGARLTADDRTMQQHQRTEMRVVGSVTADRDGPWVLLVTDTRPRGNRHHLFAIGKLSEQRINTVSDAAWGNYLAAVDGARDLMLDAVTLQDLRQQVRSGQRTLHRLRPTDRLFPGYVLWVRAHRGSAVGLALSQTWRHAGAGTTGERLPPSFHPCGSQEELCPTCRLLGASPTSHVDRRDGIAPLPYRGHVRFADLLASGPVSVRYEDLAPMSSPRPGSGNFYLEHGEAPASGRAAKEHPALSEWGSELDQQSRRPVRGRKFYWHTSPRQPAPRYRAHTSHVGAEGAGGLLSRAELIEPGATFAGRLTFENLEPAQLGALLVALDPSLLPGAVPVGQRCWHVGGGRPLGLGSVRCTGLAVKVELGNARYRGLDPAPAAPESIQAWVEDMKTATPREVQDTWPELATLLTMDAVNPALVSYPREGLWPDRPDEDHRRLWAPGLSWWTASRGAAADTPGRGTYHILPGPLDPERTLPVDPLEDVDDDPPSRRHGQR